VLLIVPALFVTVCVGTRTGTGNPNRDGEPEPGRGTRTGTGIPNRDGNPNRDEPEPGRG